MARLETRSQTSLSGGIAEALGGVKLHLRSDLHIARKLWHITTGLSIVLIYNSGMPRHTAVVVLGCLLAFFMTCEIARLKIPSVNSFALRLVGPFMRTHETQQLSGVPYYLAAAILAVGVFPKTIAVLSLLYLAIGDPVASTAGILYGSKGPRFKSGKTLIGAMAAVSVCMALTLLVMGSAPITGGELLALILIGGIAGGTAELLPLEIDDNFSIPIVSGFVLWLTFIILGI